MDEARTMELLRLLHDNARLSVETAATLLGETPEAVAAAIERLEREKVIVRYGAVVNWDKVDPYRVLAVIDVKVTPERGVGFDAIAERIYRYPEVRAVKLMSGAYDLQVAVQGRHIREVAEFVSEKLSTLEHVNSTTTHFLLKTYKEDGFIYEDREQDQRLVVTP